jgi:hypothetical protein
MQVPMKLYEKQSRAFIGNVTNLKFVQGNTLEHNFRTLVCRVKDRNKEIYQSPKVRNLKGSSSLDVKYTVSYKYMVSYVL